MRYSPEETPVQQELFDLKKELAALKRPKEATLDSHPGQYPETPEGRFSYPEIRPGRATF